MRPAQALLLFFFTVIAVSGNGTGEIKTLKTADGIELEFSWIPPGSFMMGRSWHRGDQDERPYHRVVLTKGFWMSRHEVTQDLWRSVTGSCECYFNDGQRPVDSVSFIEAEEFIKKLNRKTGRKFRLPTEAEWEYAYRAGTDTVFWWGDDYDHDCAWGYQKADVETKRVGLKKPNPWGLFDMAGNVWEWCSDWYDPEYYLQSPGNDPVNIRETGRRVMRGGCFNYNDASQTAHVRCGILPEDKWIVNGIRIVLDE